VGSYRPRRLSAEDADRPEQLVPIRLEFDVEHHKMRDTFVWNLNGSSFGSAVFFFSFLGCTDPVITPENFAQTVVEDYSLPTSYHSVIVKSIQDQLSDFKAHSNLFPEGEDGEAIVEDVLYTGALKEEDVAWWASWRKRLRMPAGKRRCRKRRKCGEVKEDEVVVGLPMELGKFVLDDTTMQDDMRIAIKVRSC
jgi:SWI/SNF-related matrix-associated actin-dependent regulator of chromatin subfamily B member 1